MRGSIMVYSQIINLTSTASFGKGVNCIRFPVAGSNCEAATAAAAARSGVITISADPAGVVEVVPESVESDEAFGAEAPLLVVIAIVPRSSGTSNRIERLPRKGVDVEREGFFA